MPSYVRNIDGRNQPVTISVNIAASQTIEMGDLIQINATSRKGEKAVAASDTLIGIANASIATGSAVTEDDNIPVILLDGAIIRVGYVGTEKTSLAEGDLYSTLFDLADEKSIGLDDTTGGMCRVVAYDNEKNTADVVIARANYALA